ncbi:MAG: hypothetical protein HRU70_00985 [Phycisphaeraceae bacterium]|nr:MAG: hypothetical protein HRU70_00985 [Phycisphaeraceae bacterium]
MRLAVLPHHLTTREPAAMATLLLATRVYTFMPGVGVPGSGREIARAAKGSASYRRLVESWGWSLPLWNQGVVASAIDGDDAASDARAVWERLERDERFAALRLFLRPAMADDLPAYLEKLASDVLKGGPDPAYSVPMAAALDRFATRHGLGVSRAEAVSVAQRAEEALGETLASVVVPVLLQSDARRISLARERLAPELSAVRGAVASLIEGRASPGLRSAAAAYTAAFEASLPELTADQREDEARVVAGAVRLSFGRYPSDAALVSSANAASRLTPGLGLRVGGDKAGEPGVPAVYDPVAAGRFTGMTVRVVARSAGRSGALRAGR